MSDYEITNTMIALGGSFVSKLGQLYQFGDRENQARIKAAWPELFEQYAELAALKAGK